MGDTLPRPLTSSTAWDVSGETRGNGDYGDRSGVLVVVRVVMKEDGPVPPPHIDRSLTRQARSSGGARDRPTFLIERVAQRSVRFAWHCVLRPFDWAVDLGNRAI